MKRIISAGLCTAFILSLAGCARQDTTPSLTAADTTDTQMGRWVESRVDLGGEQLISYPTQLADGTIVLYTGKVGEDSIEDYTRRNSTDGTNWTSEPAAFDVGDAMVTWILVAPDGEQALITYDGENAGLVLQAPDGTKTVVEDDTVKQGINPNTAVFQGDKLDFVSNGGTVDFVQVSLTDGSVTTAALPQDLAYSLNSLTTVGNQLVYLSFDNNTGDIILNALDPATGASTELLNPVPNATSSQALTGDADGAAYYACTDGIYRLAPGGTLPEQVVPAEGTAMSISSNYPLSLLRTAAEDFMVLLFGDSGGNGDLYFYHYDETLPTHADTTLTVWSLADSATARLAVNAYKKANPEVDVTFETAVQTDTDDVSAAINDALTQLNTELLAGEGPDVLLLDRVDYTTYINKGMLADMSDTVPLDALQSNIIDPFMTDGRAYVLPARFIVPALCGDAGTLDGLTDLAAFADKLEVAFKPETLKNTLGEYLASCHKTQLRIAETEKYAHVTFFLNGGREEKFANEERILIPSPKVATYDLKPEMSAYEVKDALVGALSSGRFDFIALNFANGDMVGHTGVYDAITKAVKAVDECAGEVIEAAKRNGYEVVVIADHGNADKMYDPDPEHPFTAHTHSLNPVPIIVVSDRVASVADGVLADVAPTVLALMGLPQPKEMTGKALVSFK